MRPEVLKSTLPKPIYQDNNFIEKQVNTLNSSWDSSRNVDCSDLVLKGDVMPTLKRNSSAVEASNATLRMVDMMTTQDSRASYKNMRYNVLEQNSGYLEYRESKNSPDLSKHTTKISNNDHQNKLQQDLIWKLQDEISRLKLKLQYFEVSCKCRGKGKYIAFETNYIFKETREVGVAVDFENDFTNKQHPYRRVDKEAGEKSRFLENNYNELKDPKARYKSPTIGKESVQQYQLDTSEKSKETVYQYKNQRSPAFAYNEPEPRFTCDYSIDHEQQSSKFCIPPDTDDTPSPRKHVSQVNFPKIKQTPLRKVLDKSPIMDKEETEELFKSYSSRYEATSSNPAADMSDASYSKLKMINPLDKSGFTPNSICRSGNKSSLRTCQEDWTVDLPAIIRFDCSDSGSNKEDSPQ